MKWKSIFLSLACLLLTETAIRAEELTSGHHTPEEECHKLSRDEIQLDDVARQRCLDRYLTVVVTGTRTEKQVKKIPASVTVVDSVQIERNPSDSIAEALRDVPGVEISDAGQAGLKRITLRGEEPRRVTILIDGQEFYDPRDVGTPILIAPEIVERIEVVRGPASVLYGSRAIGGVINIITKKGGYNPLQATISSQYDSSATGFVEYGSLYGSYDGFDYRISGTFSDYDNRDTGFGELDNTAFTNNSGSAYIARRLDKSVIAFQYDQFNSDNEVYVDPVDATTPPLIDFAVDVPQRDREKYAWFYDYKDVGGSLERAHFDLYVQNNDRDFNTYSTTLVDIPPPVTTNTQIFTSSQITSVGANPQLDFRIFNDHLMTLGGQFIDDDLDQARRREVKVEENQKPTELVTDSASQTTFALFVQDDWQFAKNWSLVPGIRNYWIDSELDETTRPGLSPASNSDDQLIGSVSLSYSGIEDLVLWAKVGQGYVNPTLVELHTGAFAGPSFVNPNRDLNEETSISYDIGGRYSYEAFSIDTSFFYSEAEDYINHVLCSSTTAMCIQPATARDRVYVNIDEAKTFGMEGSVSYAFDYFTPYSSVTWQRREYETSEYSTYDSGLPLLSSRTGIRIEHEMTPRTKLWSDLYVRMAADSTEKESLTEEEFKAGWGTLNLASGVDIGSKRQYRVIVEVVNIFDKAYTPAQENLAGAGASALVKLVVNL